MTEPVDINTPFRVTMRKIYNALLCHSGSGVLNVPEMDGYLFLQYLTHNYFVPPHINITMDIFSYKHIYEWLRVKTCDGKAAVGRVPLCIDTKHKKFLKAFNLFKLKYPNSVNNFWINSNDMVGYKIYFHENMETSFS